MIDVLHMDGSTATNPYTLRARVLGGHPLAGMLLMCIDWLLCYHLWVAHQSFIDCTSIFQFIDLPTCADISTFTSLAKLPCIILLLLLSSYHCCCLANHQIWMDLEPNCRNEPVVVILGILLDGFDDLGNHAMSSIGPYNQFIGMFCCHSCIQHVDL